MKMRVLFLSTLLVPLTLAPSFAAEIKDTAELFPAETLAYLEVRHPQALSREAAGLIKGSALENLPATLAAFREKFANDRMRLWETQAVAMLGTMFGPEMIGEFGRLQGAAVGLTGFHPDEGPEIVGIILTGESNIPSLVMRVYLAEDVEIRKVGVCEEVTLFRAKGEDFGNRPKPPAPGVPPPPPVIRERGPTYAMLPGVIIIGSTTDSVKELIKRVKGKTADPSLAGVRAFKDAAKQRDKPGLFGYANGGEMSQQIDKFLKKEKERLGPEAALHWASVIKSVVNPAAFRTIAASWTLENGETELRVDAVLEPKQSSPLLDLLADKKAPSELMHFLPRDGQVTVAMSLADGDKKMAKLLGVLDALCKEGAQPEESYPGKIIRELEEKMKIDLAKDLWPNVTGAAISVGGGDTDLHGMPSFTIALGAKDADAAKLLQDKVMPKLVGMILLHGESEPKIPTETVQGRDITHFSAEGMNLHFGRHESTLVLGTDPKLVAQGLTGGSKKAGLLGEAKVAAALKDVNDVQLVGVWSLGGTMTAIANSEGTGREIRKPGPPGGAPPPPDKNPKPKPEEDPLSKDFLKASDSLPPAVISLVRKPEGMTLQVRQPGLKGFSAKAITYVIETSLKRALGVGNATFEKVGEAIPPDDK
jgi:hypothetical protein